MLKRFITYAVIGGGLVSTARSLQANDYDWQFLGIVRLSRAAVTVFDVGYTYKTQLFYKDWDKMSTEYKEVKHRVHKIAAQKLLDLARTNRGVYIKVGQHIGALDYLLPTEYVETMKVLHSDAPKNPVEDLYKVIKQDLHKNPEEIFEYFEEEPLGTASLAQVHKAKLKTGEIVAVKVQHPYVKGNSRVDMKTMEILVKIMSYIFPEFKIQWLVDESKKNLPVELDFIQEGKNAEKVANMFKNYEWLKVPRIYWDYSTNRVLVMEYLEGGQVNNLEYIKNNKIDPLDISNKLGHLYSHMIFKKGFVHSDPHPGNILVHKNVCGKTDVILLDHGLYANLTEKFRYEYSQLWLSILRIDKNAMKEHAMNLGIKGNLYGLFACMVTGRPWESLQAGIDKIKYDEKEKNIIQTNMGSVITYIGDILDQVDRQMLLVLKTNDLIRGIESTLNTQYRMAAFRVMSKCCVHSVYDIEMRNATRRIDKFKAYMKFNWEIFKLNLYYFYLGLRNFSFR